jgi:CarD family transcriptional regulator
MLKIGEYVMKNSEGVCRVDEKVMMQSYDSTGEVPYFLLVPIRDGRCRVYVPQADSYRDIRPVMSKGEAEKLIGKIPKIDPASIENDRAREQIYKDAIRSLDPVRIVSVIKNMYERSEERLRQGKKRTSVDDRYFKLAEETLFQELSFALKEEPETVRRMIEDIANR